MDNKQLASIRIVELDLAQPLEDLLKKGSLPIETRVTAPKPGSMSADLMAALTKRATLTTGEIFAKHRNMIFSAGEHNIILDSSCVGREVFVIATNPFPELPPELASAQLLVNALLPNNYVTQIQLVGDALKRHGAEKVHLIIPQVPYGRQDQDHNERAPVGALVMAKNVRENFDSVTFVHLHAAQIGSMYTNETFHIQAPEVFAGDFLSRDPETFERRSKPLTVEDAKKFFSEMVLVSPDAGGVKAARAFAKYCKKMAIHLLDGSPDGHGGTYDKEALEAMFEDIPVPYIDKRRNNASQMTEVMSVAGGEHVAGRTAVLFDDIFDTGGTAMGAADALKKAGARSVAMYATHGLFKGNALQKLLRSNIMRIVTTNSVSPSLAVRNHPKVDIISLAPVIAQVMADLTTRPDANIAFNSRHTAADVDRDALGRFAFAMMPAPLRSLQRKPKGAVKRKKPVQSLAARKVAPKRKPAPSTAARKVAAIKKTVRKPARPAVKIRATAKRPTR